MHFCLHFVASTGRLLEKHTVAVGTKWREETHERWVFNSLFYFSFQFMSCHRCMLSKWEFTIWRSGFLGCIKHRPPSHPTKKSHKSPWHRMIFFPPLSLPFYWFIRSQGTGASYLKGIKTVLSEVTDLSEQHGSRTMPSSCILIRARRRRKTESNTETYNWFLIYEWNIGSSRL